MLKSLIIAAALITCGSLVKAQSLSNYKLMSIDTTINLSKQLQQLKADTSWLNLKSNVVPYNQLLTQKPIDNNLNAYLNTDNFKSNMPVARLQSADRMPVLKLGDTDQVHYTMRIKRLSNAEATVEQPKP